MNLLERRKAEAARPPTFSEASSTWSQLTAKLLGLCAREADLLAESAEAGRSAPRIDTPVSASAPKRPLQPRQVSAAARELLGDLAPEPLPTVDPNALVWSSPFAEQAHKRSVELAAVREALAEVREQLRTEHARASRLFCATHVADYSAQAAAVIQALVGLARAYREHQAFTASFTEQGANVAFFGLLRVDLLADLVGDLDGYAFTTILESARESGHHDAGAAVAELRGTPKRPRTADPFEHGRKRVAESEAKLAAAHFPRRAPRVKLRVATPAADRAAALA